MKRWRVINKISTSRTTTKIAIICPDLSIPYVSAGELTVRSRRSSTIKRTIMLQEQPNQRKVLAQSQRGCICALIPRTGLRPRRKRLDKSPSRSTYRFFSRSLDGLECKQECKHVSIQIAGNGSSCIL